MFERFTEPAREAVLAEVMRIVISDERSGGRQVPFTPNAEKVLERALSEARAVGHKHIGPEHILLGLLDDPGIAGRILFTPTSRARRLMIAAAGHAVDDGRPEYDVCDCSWR